MSVAEAAPPTLDYVFPPGLKRGSTNSLTVGGKFEPWPVSVWVDCPGVSFTAETNSGKFSMAVSSEVPLGPHLLRVYNTNGASSPRWFVFTKDQDELEKEPNDSVKLAQRINKLPIAIDGRLEKGGDVDSFAVNVEAGKWLVARVDAFSLGSPVDAVLHLFNDQGVRLAFNHDSARSLDPLLAYKVEKTGTYILQVAGFVHPPAADVRFAGSAATIYRLSITDGPFAAHAFPVGIERGKKASLQLLGWNLRGLRQAFDSRCVSAGSEETFIDVPGVDSRAPIWITDMSEVVEIEPNNTCEQAQAVAPPCGISGRIGVAGDEDRFRFNAKKGERFDFQIQSASLGFPLEATLAITDTAGQQLTRADEHGSPEPKLSWTAPTNGSYIAAVGELFHKRGDDFVYRLAIGPPKPDFKVTVAEHAVRLEASKTNEIKVEVTRLNGHTNALAITFEDLPEGISAKSPDVPVKSGEVKVALIADPGAKSANQPFRIVVRATDSSTPSSRAALFDLKGKDSPGHRLIDYTDKLWLTVLERAGNSAIGTSEEKK